MPSNLTSECAGLVTAFLWALSALCWAELSQRIHATVVATVRLVFAVVALAGIHLALFGRLWPAGVPATALWVLCLSGIAGAGIGDIFYVHAIQRIGPRMTMTITALAPVIAAALALAPPMNERMSLPELAGMALAVGGVVWVVAEKDGRKAWPATAAAFRLGIILAVLSVTFQAIGFTCSRAGMNAFSATPVPAFSATLIRVTAASVWCCGMVVAQGQVRAVSAFRSRSALVWLALGVAAGPVVGIWLSMIALQGSATGVASTLISSSPLFLIPMSWIAYGEKPTPGRVVATLVALGGIACLMLGGRT